MSSIYSITEDERDHTDRGQYILDTFKNNGYTVKEEKECCYKITNKKTKKSFTITPFEDIIYLETEYNLENILDEDDIEEETLSFKPYLIGVDPCIVMENEKVDGQFYYKNALPKAKVPCIIWKNIVIMNINESYIMSILKE